MAERILRGVAAAAGLALGPARIHRGDTPAGAGAGAAGGDATGAGGAGGTGPAGAGGAGTPAAGDPAAERQRFQAAVAAVDRDLERLQAAADPQAREILAAHRLMLADPELHSLVEAGLARGLRAEAAVQEATEQLAALLAGLEDPYLRERAADVRDVGRRLVAALTGGSVGLRLEAPAVVVARDLAPTDTIGVDRRLLLGIVTEHGGPTSHTAILARSWGIPAVVGVPGLLDQIEDGMTVAVDGDTGTVVLDPAPETARRLDERLRAQAEARAREQAETGLPAKTPDGRRVELAGNAKVPGDVTAALDRGAEGIGLLRSEFLFMGRSAPPDEEEQYRAYSEALRLAEGRRVIIRTLDIGGDKGIPYLGLPREENPFLGVRALRLCFRRPDLFQTQLRALLRAGVHGRLAVMFPMVSTLEDLQGARAALEEARAALAAAGIPHAPAPEVGIMIEVPSAALIAHRLAQEVDFFSIGTNDLVQYTLAVDRGHPELTGLYQPCHPAVLRLIDEVVRAAHGAGKWVGVCGEMAGDPLGALLLLGLGVDELSMAPPALPAVRRLIRSVPHREAEALARAALACGTAGEVEALARPVLERLAATGDTGTAGSEARR